MRCFWINEEEVRSSIAVQTAPYPHIGVGEAGRGREYVRFPLGSRFAEALAKASADPQYPRVERASVMRTAKGSLLLVEEQDASDARALALVNISAGYRGGVRYFSTSVVTRPCKHRGQSRWGMMEDFLSNDASCKRCKQQLLQADGQELVHPDAGEMRVYDAFPPAGVTILAQGYCAQGDAGRMGGHATYLLLMEPGASFRAYREGRLYGAPAVRVVLWTGEELRLGTMDEVFPPVEEEGGTFV